LTALLRVPAALGLISLALLRAHFRLEPIRSPVEATSASVKVTETTKMFRIAWGDDPGKFHKEESELGYEADTFPRKYVRDRQGNFYFLEPGPPARLSKFSNDGRLLSLFDLSQAFPLLTSKDVITPQELFLQADGNPAALLRVYLAVEKREEMHLAYFSPTGTLKNVVQYSNFKLASFQLDNASFLDKEGYLWVLGDGGACEIYGPTGQLAQPLPFSGSYVDGDGRLYSGFNPLRLYGRSGQKADEILFEGHSASDEPEEIDGASGAGFLFSWRSAEKTRKADVFLIPRILDFYRLTTKHGKFEHVGEAILPPSKYRKPNPRSEYIERTELYENRLVFDDVDNVYFLGRSPKECWIEKVHLEFK